MWDGPAYDPPDAELALPAVRFSKDTAAMSVLFSLADCTAPPLRDHARAILHQLPTDPSVLQRFREVFHRDLERVDSGGSDASQGAGMTLPVAASTLFPPASRPFLLLYRLETLQSLLLPSTRPGDEAVIRFRRDFVRCNGVGMLVSALRPSPTMDTATQTAATVVVLALAEFLFDPAARVMGEQIVDASPPELEVVASAAAAATGPSMLLPEDPASAAGIQRQVSMDGASAVIEAAHAAGVLATLADLAWCAAVNRLCESEWVIADAPVGAAAGRLDPAVADVAVRSLRLMETVARCAPDQLEVLCGNPRLHVSRPPSPTHTSPTFCC